MFVAVFISLAVCWAKLGQNLGRWGKKNPISSYVGLCVITLALSAVVAAHASCHVTCEYGIKTVAYFKSAIIRFVLDTTKSQLVNAREMEYNSISLLNACSEDAACTYYQ